MSEHLQKAADIALSHAKKLGMQQAEVSLHLGTGVSVTARQQELETVEKNNDAQLVINVYQQHKTGSASSADLSEKGIQETVAAACSIASYTGADDCFGLADKELMASQEIDLDLHHPWVSDINTLADLALRCEQAALDVDAKISNSEGASVSSYEGDAVYANSHGFMSSRRGSQHSLSCSVIGGIGDNMQRDYWYDSNRDPAKLMATEDIGRLAGQRTIARLGSQKIESTEASVLFDPQMAKSLVGHLIGALKGGVIYKKASFMLDKIGQQVLPEFVNLTENPHLRGGSGSAWHDGEGVATQEQRSIVEAGKLRSYVLGSYTARKLGLSTTANSGGVRNLRLSDTGQTQQELLTQMGRGLLVTELIGSGINMVTGDYSRGAAGFWVDNGEIQFPVEEITIAGNLTEMYQNIVAIGADTDWRGNTAIGSVLLNKMTIAGS